MEYWHQMFDNNTHNWTYFSIIYIDSGANERKNYKKHFTIIQGTICLVRDYPMLVLWSHYFCGVKDHLLLNTLIYKFINSVGSIIHKSMNVVETLIQNSWILWIGTTKLILKNFIKLMFDYILRTSNPWKLQPTNWMILQWITRLYTECKIKIYKNSTAILTWTYLEMMQCKYIITDSRLLLGKTVYITQNDMIWTILIYITSLYTQSGVKCVT